MNRNQNSHFSKNPQVDIQRSRFDRSSSVKFSGNVGDIIPFYVDEVLPGDTFDIELSKLVRLQTLITPVMDNLYLDTYWFYVPYRLVWDHWKEFMGENTKAPWFSDVEYSIPQVKCPGVVSTIPPDNDGNDYYGWGLVLYLITWESLVFGLLMLKQILPFQLYRLEHMLLYTTSGSEMKIFKLRKI